MNIHSQGLDFSKITDALDQCGQTCHNRGELRWDPDEGQEEVMTRLKKKKKNRKHKTLRLVDHSEF